MDADIIVPTDSSAFVSSTYTGTGIRTIYDRRVSDWITVEAFLFEVVWNDGLTTEAVVNPEFTTVALAGVEAEKYGRSIGQLPYCLRTDVNEIWINKGVQPFGGGNQSILIHTGQTVLYENDGILEETLVHEASHTSLDAAHAASAGWLEAQTLDGGFISDYAQDYPDREDIAESFLMWLAVRYREDRISTLDYNLTTGAIPNRLTYFDGIDCDLFPFEVENITSLNEPERNSVTLYPNPTEGLVQLRSDDEDAIRVTVCNALGAVLLDDHFSDQETVDLSAFPSGMYALTLHRDGKPITKRLVKL